MTTTKKTTTKTTKATTTTTTTTRKKKSEEESSSSSSSSSSCSSFLRRQIILPISDVFVAIKSMNVRQLTLQLLSLTLIVTSALMIWKSLCLYTHSESPVVVVLSGSMEPAFKRGDILFLSLKKIKEDNFKEEEERRKTRVGEIIVFSIDGREIPIVHRVIKSHFHPFVSPPSSSSSSSSSSLPTTKKEGGENEKDQGRGGNNSGEDGLSNTRSDGSGSSEGDDNNNNNNNNNNNSSEEETSSSSSQSSLFKHEMLTKGDNNYMDDIGLYAPGQKWLNEKHVMGRTVGYLPHVGKATILMNDHPMIKYALIFILGLLVISGKEG